MKNAGFPLGEVDQLANGLTLVAVELPHVSAGYAAVMVRTGPRYEDARTHGLSHFCEHMLFRGCGKWRTAQEIARVAEGFCGSVEAVTYRDHAVYSTAFEPTAAPRALDLLASMMRAPRFEGLAVEKRVILEEISECFDENGREIEIDNISRQLLYPDDAAGLSIDGTPQSVSRFRRADLVEHHARFYGAANMVLAVAGPMPPSRVMRQARAAFRGLPSGQRARLASPAQPSRGPRFRHVRHPGSQSELRLSFHAFSATATQVPALQMLRRVLDDGFTSRFQAELVDRRGLAYEMWADVDLAEDCGSVEFGAAVTHGKEARTVRALLQEAQVLADTGPRRDELTRARVRFAWALRQMHDQPAAVAEWHGRSLLLGLERRPQHVLKSVSAVRPGDVRRVAEEVFRAGRCALTVVGAPPRRELDAARRALTRLPE
ncbi:MAG: pitrilysin family protein [Myxococcota bacterium]